MRSTDTSLDSKLARGRHRIWPSRQLSNLWQLGILEFSRFLFRHQRLHGLFLELYSSCHHILAVHKKDYSLVHAMGLLFETDTAGFLRLNKTTQARTDYIGNLHAAHPWFSPVDVRLLLESWDAGRKFALHIHDYDKEDSKACTSIFSASPQSEGFYAADSNSAIDQM